MSEFNLKLKSYIEKVEYLEEEKKELSKSITEIYNEAKSEGFDTKAMRQVIKMRRMKDEELKEMEILIETYMNALDS
ncbi:DUF2312 domain-containing protein [Lyticum sinuosum]|uniref:DUF2312 super family protein n=1 Tax=Lyticum sinuosum TaxID=1332059 RepID=A0AAE4VL42_9RICK|nr:GapR family DNA-binding domain-containing protein [Lyticum sinuosum]MDZ5761453.1 DUF2312 super family protein [Lyticum sinuosum]